MATEIDKSLHSYSPFGFHVSRESWERFDVFEAISADETGDTISGTYHLRCLTDRYNKKRYGNTDFYHPVHAGQLVSLSIIVDIMRFIIRRYSNDQNPGVIQRGLDWIRDERGEFAVEQSAKSFVELFPPLNVIQKKTSENDYLWSASGEALNREECAVEMTLLYLSMMNPALLLFHELFDDEELRRQSPYEPMVESLQHFVNNDEPAALSGKPLFEFLKEPMRNCPDSIDGQLNYIREYWLDFLPPKFIERLSLATDILKEEERLRGLGPGPLQALQFGKHAYGMDWSYPEPERFSHDADWMSNVVLIAKSTYVWLDQLSKKYKKSITLLSDIPDEELDMLAEWGFSALWLIGLWERCSASEKIKKMMGNPEAVSSAYSLDNYDVAEDLGGEAAYQDLAERAWQRGIRLASDMVPNHMGICSEWVIKHPDWFIQLNYPPFPCYQFTGDNLCDDDRVVVQIEDGYWEHRDAAVVFKRSDKWTGDIKYIYHGNDGTSMPWNDTAQLNFMLPEVREAVIQTILHVARLFPIIRFDAAMTLAKKHYQRLWFPQPGDAGAIPSRAEHGMSKPEFDQVFPEEFWREVVNRVAEEAPDTLLLAEAFWLMEGYFVRTLGMHRVYNSAFMNMLKMEENMMYRMTVKNVLEFSPEVLKRFVNFMNNPDERTAIDQFGKDDKYFGITVLLVTMPGLPMFGHGQIEGFTEKYGMEYRRAYWDEHPDEHTVWRHETQIFPLMKKRYLFSGAENFAFFDFCTPDNRVDENVYAYSNRAGDERAIVIYNNAFNTTKGWIQNSTRINVGSGEEKNLVMRSLNEALNLNTSDDCYYIFRDYGTGLEYMRSGRQFADEGLFAELHAYQYHAFLDFREVYDVDGSWSELSHSLNGKGVPCVETAFKEMYLAPVLGQLGEVLNANMLRAVYRNADTVRVEIDRSLPGLIRTVKCFTGSGDEVDDIIAGTIHEIEVFLDLQRCVKEKGIKEDLWENVQIALALDDYPCFSRVAIACSIVRSIGRVHAREDNTDPRLLAGLRMKEWLLQQHIAAAFMESLNDEEMSRLDAMLVEILVSHGHIFIDEEISYSDAVKALFDDADVREFIKVNRYEDVLWINKEQFEKLSSALLYVSVLQLISSEKAGNEEMLSVLGKAEKFSTAAERSGYQLDKIIDTILENVDETLEETLEETLVEEAVSTSVDDDLA